MKKFLLSATALVALTTAAAAADLPSRRAPAPVFSAVPVFTWTGFYAGVQVGHTWGEGRGSLTDAAGPFLIGDYDTDGFVGGVHAGFNYQVGSFVAGVEADLEGAGIEGEVVSTNVALAGDRFTGRSEVNFQGSLRARLGVAIDRVLVYGTAGVAFANLDTAYTYSHPLVGTLNESFDNTEWGWTVGAGVEYAFTSNLTARVEYRYTQFESFRNSSRVVAPGVFADQEPEFHTVRVGLSYKF